MTVVEVQSMNKRRMLSLSFVVMTVFLTVILPKPVHAIEAYEYIPYGKTITVALNDMSGYELRASEILKGSKITKCKSSNKKVIDFNYAFHDGTRNVAYISAYKPGKATLYVTAKSKSKTKKVKIRVKVVRYKNPFKSIKYNSKKCKVTSTSEGRYINVKSPSKAGRLKVSLKKGWKTKKFSAKYYDKNLKLRMKKRSIKKKLNFKKYSYELVIYNKKLKQTLTYKVG